MTPSSHPTYLFELLDTQGNVSHCDVTVHLSNALEAVHRHLMAFLDETFEPEVELTPEQALGGIAFFDAAGQGRAFITVYNLSHDSLDTPQGVFHQVATLPAQQLQGYLATLM